MKNWKVATGVVLLVVLNFALMVGFLQRRSTQQRIPSHLEATYAKENDLISQDFAERAAMNKDSLINLIGNLTERPFWSDVLKVTGEQKKSLKKFNDIVSEARYLSWLADAKPNKGNPSDRYQRILVSDKRREDAIFQAQQMVTSGILDDKQAAFVTQRYLEAVGFNVLYDDNNYEYLGLDPAQKPVLAKVLAKYTEAGAALFSLSSQAGSPIRSPVAGPRASQAPKKELDYNRLHNDLMRNFRDAVRGTLTAAQLKKWEDIIAKRPPLEELSPQARPAASDLQALGDEARKASPTLRVLAENGRSLGLSADQKRLLKGLEEIVGQCLTCIGLDEERATSSGASKESQADRTSRARSEFLKHAERFATLGVLTEDQANQVGTLIKDK